MATEELLPKLEALLELDSSEDMLLEDCWVVPGLVVYGVGSTPDESEEEELLLLLKDCWIVLEVVVYGVGSTPDGPDELEEAELPLLNAAVEPLIVKEVDGPTELENGEAMADVLEIVDVE